MRRRSFLKTLAIGAASAVGTGTGFAFGAKTGKPNVLFIAIDDLNDWIGCLGGHPDAKTPNLDRLAKRGVLFSHAYCAAPACNPSRAALMTGIRPSTSGVYKNAQPWRNSPVLTDAVTLPQHFMAHGYHVSGSGKIYHGSFPDPASWQEYWPSQTENKPKDPSPKKKSGRPLGSGPLEADKTEMGDWKVTDWVSDQLQIERDKPFFLACGIYKPHLPWNAPQEYFDMYPVDKITMPIINDDDLDDVPKRGRQFAKTSIHRNMLKDDNWRYAVQAYLACTSFADECVGKVLDALDKSPHKDNTIIVLWSDHGWHLGEKLHWKKFALWEEATHNLMMFVAPGVTREGGRCDRTVNLLDIYPTLVELCGLSPKKELEGDSLVPLLKDPASAWKRPALTTHFRNNHSVRTERWRYTRYEDGGEELYDHDADDLEWTNLASKPEHDKVKKRLAKWLPKKNVPDIPVDSKLRATKQRNKMGNE